MRMNLFHVCLETHSGVKPSNPTCYSETYKEYCTKHTPEVLQKVKHRVTYDPEILLPGICPK